MFAVSDPNALLPAIHAAALDPLAWSPLLRRLADLTGCTAGGLTIEHPSTRHGRPITFFGFDPSHVEATFDHFLPLNPLFDISPCLQAGVVVTNGDVVPLDDFRRTAFYNGWARPQHLCSPITLILHRDNTSYVPLTLVRPDGAGEASEASRTLLERLAPHLGHALQTNLRLRLLQNRSAILEDLAARLPAAILLLDRDRRVCFANPAALAAFTNGPLRLDAGALAAHNPGFDRILQKALANALTPPTTASDLRLPQSDAPSLHVAITPLPNTEARPELAPPGPACLVMVNDPNAELAAAATQAAITYRLTSAEHRLLLCLLLGRSVAESALLHGTTVATTRTHLKNIFAKTGSRRQADLVQRILTRTPPL